ncbi:tetratricopeptide repeat protein [Hymenobacter jeollabukensis]|uniref:Uncharacterized protein n=1 Tax=Hymenobacter jeollabukensis TaxID=2025313 RepID=A0A5R8WJM1_9BACT|nr:hypothetical protein [Hymenobacter jeollabukensis]TLM88969.1 hypothetical protein FDY95_22570 [Hymenobacter jeollabukensis]
MSKFPEPVQTLYETALQHEQASDWGAAAACYEQAVTLVTDSPELWARYGLLLGREGVQNADGHIDLSACARAAKCPASTAEELYWRGVGARFNDGDGDSRRDLAASLALDPTRAEAWYHYAEALEAPAAYYFGRDYDASPEGQARRRAAYDQALTLEPDNPQYLAARGEFHLAHDRLNEALNDLNAALARSPTLRWARVRRAVILFLQHDFPGALRDFRASQAGKLRGDWREAKVEYHIRYADEQYSSPMERWEKALVLFESTGIQEPATAEYLSERARYFLAHGAAIRALTDAEAAVTLRPSHVPYREIRIACRLAQAIPDFDALLTDYEWLLERPLPHAVGSRKAGSSETPRDQALWQRARYGHQAAWANFRLGRREQALADFAAAIILPTGRLPRVGLLSGDEQLHWMGDVKELLPPVSDSEYLRWQLEHQLTQEVNDPNQQRAINEWLFAAAQVLSVLELSQAMDEYRALWLPAGHYFVQPRSAAAFATALSLFLNGMQRQPAYKAVFIQLYRNLLRSELRDAQNRPGATTEAIRDAVNHYDAQLAFLATT